MDDLRIHLLGTFQALADGAPLAGFRSSKVRALLAYLALAGERPSSRDTLAGLLWSEFDDRAAKTNLRQSLSNLRQLLPAASLTITPQTVTFHANVARVWVDAVAFQRLIADSQAHAHRSLADCPACLARLVEAAAIYRGELLAGFHVPDAPAFDEWRLAQQETLHQSAVWVLATLIESYGARGEPEAQIAYLRQQIRLEPWHEAAYRQLMTLLARQGQRSQALALFDACRRVLADELGVDPAAETLALVRRIEADELPADATLPPTAVPAHNLPAALTTFVGREAQLAEVCTRLAQPETRLLTIVGLAGAGKTRLAQAAAGRLLSEFPHGVWFVPLAALERNDAEVREHAAAQEHLATAVLSHLTQSIAGAPDPFATLTDFLRQKRLLLVLDNLEHLLPAAADFVVALLNQAPRLTILATSQMRLNCQAETLLPLHGLAVPPADAAPQAFESVQLFVERARRHDAGFAPQDAAAWASIAALCRLLEGVPLAIELAASLVAHYALADMVAAIAQDVDVLATTMQDLPPRHRTMQAAFQYAWRLLPPREQHILAQLSLFPGEFAREAALAVADAALLELMAAANRSWLRLTGPGRYALHGLIRQFTAAALRAQPALEAAAWERYGRFYLAFLQQQQARFDTPDEAHALADMGRELDNVRAAWRWLVARADWPGIDQALPGLMTFYDVKGWHREGLWLAAEALRQLPAPEDAHLPAWARLCGWQAIFLSHSSPYPRAEARLRQLVDTFEETGDAASRTRMLETLGQLAVRAGQFAAGYGWLQEALRGYEALDDERGVGRVLNQLGRYHELVGEFDLARAHYADCLALNERWGVPRTTAATRNNLGLLLHRVGDYAAAQAMLQESIAIYRALGNEFEVAAGLSNLALVQVELAAYDEARTLLAQARRIQEELGYRARLAIV
ncbi:MAG: tetratricopeptide repeat protein, partial [Anaerolineales bacterium]|nr:tetratricopeptide repeat protein [Anaerolineales bacterium]